MFCMAGGEPDCPVYAAVGATRVLNDVPKSSLYSRVATPRGRPDEVAPGPHWLKPVPLPDRPPLLLAFRKVTLKPLWMKPAINTGLDTGSDWPPLIETDASSWVVPGSPPPPKPATFPRILVMRYTRDEPDETGARIGIP